MEKHKLLAIACLASIGCIASTQGGGGPGNGKAAPQIAAKFVTGKSFDLKAESKKAPVFVYFVSTTCPVSREATPFYGKLANAYAAMGVKVVGVINDDKAGYDKWNKEHKAKYPVILDPDYKIIRAYKVTNAPSSALVAKGGKLTKFWAGYSRAFLVEASKASAKAVGKTPAKIDFSGAPAQWQAG